MTTAHAYAGETLAKKMRGAPGGRELLAWAEDWLRDPANKTLRHIYGDPYRGWISGQVAALVNLIIAGRRGRFQIASIPVGVKPARDSAREANREALADLPCGITAVVHTDPDGRGSESDGYLSIPDALDIVDDDGSRMAADAWDHVPLEIGYTDATRTYLHLAQEGAVARWPYGHDHLYVLTTTPRFSMSPNLHWEA